MSTARAISVVVAIVGIVAACSDPDDDGGTVSSVAPRAIPTSTCPCIVGDPSLEYVIACDDARCVSVGGQPKGYHCDESGAHEDDTVCLDAGKPPCVPKSCSDLGSVCGDLFDGCESLPYCGTCPSDQLCTDELDDNTYTVPAAHRCLPIPQNTILYDSPAGGLFTIEVDQDIPGLAIGLTSLEAMDVTITGAFAANVDFVYYEGNAEAAINGVANQVVTQGAIESDASFEFAVRTGAYVLFERCQTAAFSGTVKVSDRGSACN